MIKNVQKSTLLKNISQSFCSRLATICRSLFSHGKLQTMASIKARKRYKNNPIHFASLIITAYIIVRYVLESCWRLDHFVSILVAHCGRPISSYVFVTLTLLVSLVAQSSSSLVCCFCVEEFAGFLSALFSSHASHHIRLQHNAPTIPHCRCLRFISGL